MKNRSYANRGTPLETYIKLANARYRHEGIAFIEKQNTAFIPLRDASGKVCSVKVEHKATVDFLGRYKSHPIAIEAKQTSTDSIRFDEVTPNQAEDMDAFCAELGTIGLVLISFNLQRFYAVPWSFWRAAYDIRVRQKDSTTPVTLQRYGQEWTVPQKFSVRMDELNPEWEVPGKQGLRYLQNVEKYV